MNGPYMGVQVLIGFPLFLKENTVFSLNIHVAITAYAAMLTPNRAEYCFKGLQNLFPFFGRHRYLYSGVNHGLSP
jgi:hypothetical protein